MADRPLLAELQLASTQLALINEIAAQTSARPDPAEMWSVLARHARWLLPIEGVALVIVGAHDRAWSIFPESLAPTRRDPPPDSQEGALAPPWIDGGIASECLARGALVVVAEGEAPERPLTPLERELLRGGARSLAAVPLISANDRVGVLLFWSRRAEAFDFEVLRTIGLLVPHVANALALAFLVARARALTLIDPLTGLANRRHFDGRLGEEFERAERDGRALSLILLDVDDFKRINDSLGHAAGDEILCRLAKLLRLRLRALDLACRHGGEEFALILPATPVANARRVADRIRLEIAAGALGEHSDGAPITVSIGIAGSGELHTTPGRLFRAADAALYGAKASGRNRTCIAEDDGRWRDADGRYPSEERTVRETRDRDGGSRPEPGGQLSGDSARAGLRDGAEPVHRARE